MEKKDLAYLRQQWLNCKQQKQLYLASVDLTGRGGKVLPSKVKAHERLKTYYETRISWAETMLDNYGKAVIYKVEGKLANQKNFTIYLSNVKTEEISEIIDELALIDKTHPLIIGTLQTKTILTN